MIVPVVFLAVFGALIGSFLNVVVYRVPLKLSVVSPPSACPNCGMHIRAYDNVPVFSWLALRAKCRDCKAPISARYPAVELAGGLAFAGVAVWFMLTRWPQQVDANAGLSGASLPGILSAVLELVAFLYLVAISLALALIDLDTHTLPNRIVLPAYGVGAVLLGASGVIDQNGHALLGAAIGCAALYAFYFLIAFISPRGMGFGDVKLAGVLGLFLGFLGWGPLIVGAFAGFFVGGLFALALVALRRAGRKTGIPFGPWMLVGAWIGVVAGAPIAHAYLGLFGLT